MSAHGTASDVVRGTFVEFSAAVLRNLPRDLDPDVELGWTTNGEALARTLRSALVPNGKETATTPVPAPARPEPSQSVYPLTVDYARSVKDGVKAGRYDWKNDDITDDHFPHDRKRGTVATEVILVHFGRNMSSDAVEAALDRLGLKSADLPTLLALGSNEATRDLQRGFPIVALGSEWQDPDGGRNVPYLDWYRDKRHLDLDWRDDDWLVNYRFAALRK